MNYLIANWKQNKTVKELRYWVDRFVGKFCDGDKLQVILAASHPLLYPLNEVLKSAPLSSSHNIVVASQDVSSFPSGAHTGEVGAFQLKEFVEYSIIGHSERRLQGESSELVNDKIKHALEYNITPILCFSGLDELREVNEIYGEDSGILYAYEPVEAIGTGNPASVNEVRRVFLESGLKEFIYGGSVDKTSIHNYLKQDFINGFLVGSASLDPVEFGIIANKLVYN